MKTQHIHPLVFTFIHARYSVKETKKKERESQRERERRRLEMAEAVTGIYQQMVVTREHVVQTRQSALNYLKRAHQVRHRDLALTIERK